MRRFFFPVLSRSHRFHISRLSQAKHPFTFEDMMKLKRVGEPVVSPDGKWVIFSVVDVDLEANTKTPHIWIVPTAGGQEREIIADQDADRPRWAPDGTSFAFISTKEGGSQIWIAEFDSATGTVAKKGRLTDIATEAGGETWSPNGKYSYFHLRCISRVRRAARRDLLATPTKFTSMRNRRSRPLSSIICSIATGTPTRKVSEATSFVSPFLLLSPAVIPIRLIITATTTSPPAITMRLFSHSVGRTTMPSRPTGRRFATPRITIRIQPLPPTTISGRFPLFFRTTQPPRRYWPRRRTSPPTIPPATRRRSIRPMAATSPTAPSSVPDTRATASA